MVEEPSPRVCAENLRSEPLVTASPLNVAVRFNRSYLLLEQQLQDSVRERRWAERMAVVSVLIRSLVKQILLDFTRWLSQ